MEFPDLHDKNVLANDNALLKSAIDYAQNKWQSKIKKSVFNDLYGGYNGILNKLTFQYITKTYGTASRTKYVDYRLPRSKIKTLTGEFLEINLDPKVYTTNKEAQVRKYDKVKDIIGLMHGKAEIETVRQSGMNAFPGVNIPDKDEPGIFEKLTPKLQNEVAFEYLLQDAIKNGRIKRKLCDNLTDLLITSECCCKIEENELGYGFIPRFIPAKLAMFEEGIGDDSVQRSPYKGEVRPMFVHEILAKFNLKKEDREKLKDAQSNPSDILGEGNYNNKTETLLVNTYTIEVIVMERVPIKKSINKNSGMKYQSIIPVDNFYKNQESIEKDVEKGKYEVDSKYRQALYEITKIGQDIYCNTKKVANIVQRTNELGKKVTAYNYLNLLLGTVDGTRISIFQLMYELSVQYNIIRFMMNRELAKYKGKGFTYDEAYLPAGKTYMDILHRLTEDSIITYNSKQPGNDEDDPRAKDSRSVIEERDLGLSQGFPQLVAAAMDIERALSSITGITDARQGTSKASTTATGIENSVTASRSQTQDIFFFFEEYINDVLTHIVERKKAKMVASPDERDEMIVGANGIQYLIDNRDMILDDYAAFIGNGRKENELKQRMQTWVQAQINAGELRASDVARAELKETMAEYLEVLDSGWETIQKANQETSKTQAAENVKNLQEQIRAAKENTEDLQAHELDKINLKGEWDMRIKTGSDAVKMETDEKKIQADLYKAGMSQEQNNKNSESLL